MARSPPAPLNLAPPRAPDGRASLSDTVYETLLAAILSGKLASGTILSEVAVSKQLAVSRTPVHDALRQLAKDGLVTQATGRRARVVPFTRDDLHEIYELRKLLEGRAAELAAGRMDARQLGPLRSAADELLATVGAAGWVARWTDFDEDFHRTIAEASGNRRLAEDITRYRLLHRGFNRMSTDAHPLPQALAEHVAILDALEHRDPARARAAMVRHLENWQQFFVRHFPR